MEKLENPPIKKEKGLFGIIGKPLPTGTDEKTIDYLTKIEESLKDTKEKKEPPNYEYINKQIEQMRKNNNNPYKKEPIEGNALMLITKQWY